MPEAVGVPIEEQPSQGYQLRVVQEVVLALLAKEASHGYQLRARLQLALGPLAEALNAGQVYVTLTRLEKAGLVHSERVGQTDRPDRKVYDLTAAGRARVGGGPRQVSPGGGAVRGPARAASHRPARHRRGAGGAGGGAR